MSPKRALPIAQITVVGCSLDEHDQHHRANIWQGVRDRWLEERQAIPGGMRLVLDPRAAHHLVALAEQEAVCCPSLTIDVTAGDRVVVHLTGPPEAQPMIRTMTGLP